MANLFVLIMVIGGSTSQSGLTSITQEFTTFERCESARKSIATIHERNYTPVKHQGCYPK